MEDNKFEILSNIDEFDLTEHQFIDLVQVERTINRGFSWKILYYGSEDGKWRESEKYWKTKKGCIKNLIKICGYEINDELIKQLSNNSITYLRRI